MTLVTPHGRFALPPEALAAGAAALVIRPEHLAAGRRRQHHPRHGRRDGLCRRRTRLLFALPDGDTAVLRLPTGMAPPADRRAGRGPLG